MVMGLTSKKPDVISLHFSLYTMKSLRSLKRGTNQKANILGRMGLLHNNTVYPALAFPDSSPITNE
jgi:hypothetical protein